MSIKLLQIASRIKSNEIREKILFTLYAVYEIDYYFFGVSRINSLFDTSRITFMVNLLVMIGLSLFVLVNHYTLPEIVIIGFGVLLGLYAFVIVKLNVLLISVLFMSAAKKVKLNWFIRRDFILRTTLLISIIFANRIGWIPSVVGLREGTFTFVRDSLGFGQFNITGALIMICILEYIYLNFGKLTAFAYESILILVFLTLVTTNSRGSMLAVLLYVLFSWIYQNHPEAMGQFVKRNGELVKYQFGIFSIFSIAIVTWFDYNSSFWKTLNNLVSDRINILNQYYLKFGIHLLPQKVGDYRSAGAIVMDNVYATLAIQYGLLILLIFVIVYYVLAKRAFQAKNIGFVLMLVVLMVFGLIESTFFIIGINFTIMMVFANVETENDSKLGSVS
ncbi:putative membrane protein [Secundilactobacillus pentosiphilus]|uniref:Putative membrane protein n=1 Tax=Secundilactobacillus pentosiphilus TaxID=1714682 RepID=A0A1Z5IU56_9LACO|nr:hypothetical protein [Secundilactobacillus pentosiphilus]GAX05148.1 putative membrane protein [Secundilactobacillus pentosiphilus]